MNYKSDELPPLPLEVEASIQSDYLGKNIFSTKTIAYHSAWAAPSPVLFCVVPGLYQGGKENPQEFIKT
jgi:hypothetical protein